MSRCAYICAHIYGYIWMLEINLFLFLRQSYYVAQTCVEFTK